MHATLQLEELNIKPKSWKDLLTDEPFTRKDIIHIQDPLNLQVLHRYALLLLGANQCVPYSHAQMCP
jgi:hypothetical protein